METNTTCPNCHQPLDPGATFCGNCGHKIEVSTATVASPIVSYPPTNDPNAPQAPVVGGDVPAYAVAKPETGAEKKSIIALILGVVGIPAALLPIAGLILGIGGLVLGTTARVKYKHTLNLLAIIFSSIAIVLALGIWVSRVNNQSTNSSTSAYVQKGPFVTVNTACYKVKIDKGMPKFTGKGCNFDASSKSEEFAVVALKDDSVNKSNIVQYGSRSLIEGADSSGGKITNGHVGTFDGSTAYLADYSSTKNNTSGIFAFVIHLTPKGDNIFIIGRAVGGRGLDSFGTLESTWQWK